VQPSALKTVTEATECNVAPQVLLLILQSQRNHLILLHKFRCFLMYRQVERVDDGRAGAPGQVRPALEAVARVHDVVVDEPGLDRELGVVRARKVAHDGEFLHTEDQHTVPPFAHCADGPPRPPGTTASQCRRRRAGKRGKRCWPRRRRRARERARRRDGTW
jgi:hypothetical protein